MVGVNFSDPDFLQDAGILAIRPKIWAIFATGWISGE